jgi:hypothetical protein
LVSVMISFIPLMVGTLLVLSWVFVSTASL